MSSERLARSGIQRSRAHNLNPFKELQGSHQIGTSVSNWGRKLIIVDGPSHSRSDVRYGNEAFQAVMSLAMQPIRNSNRSGGGCNLDAEKEWFIVHDRVIEQQLLPAARAKLQGGSVVQPPGCGDPGNQQDIGFVPKFFVSDGRLDRRLCLDWQLRRSLPRS